MNRMIRFGVGKTHSTVKRCLLGTVMYVALCYAYIGDAMLVDVPHSPSRMPTSVIPSDSLLPRATVDRCRTDLLESRDTCGKRRE